VTGNSGDAEGLVAVRTSTDLLNWTYRGPVFSAIPAWAAAAIPGTGGIWAPDISKRNGQYRLYYAVSTFGSNHSAIGLTTNTSLDPASPQSGWTDQGEVIESRGSDDYNAIDPNVFDDDQGREWLVFGSFWSGIKAIALDPATGKQLTGDTTVHALAERPAPDAIEGAYVFGHGGYYYLFASFDFCCRGANSTYYTVVGRSTDPLGPYVDRDGREMLQGGGTTVLTSGQGDGSRYVGRGHVALLHDDDGDYIVYHAYDTQQNGVPTLRIRRVAWSSDGWPEAQ
jgi:arabinan endo-1,5-alpha-L-arabinosidase